jgi:glycosyltransferase involved in cell wall biosynthesis
MPSSPSFSVILPVFNRETTIVCCLQSMADQSYRPLEVIAVDDGSRDGSLAALERWRERLPELRIVAKENGGVASARNAALQAASGDWLAFIDSDDEWAADKLARFAALIETDASFDMVHSDRVAANGTTRRERIPDVAEERYADPYHLLTEWAIVTSTVAVRGMTAERAGKFIENLYSCSDYEWFWRVVALSRRIGYLGEALTIMHNGPSGMARALPEPQRLRDNIRAMASAIAWLESAPEIPAAYAATLRLWRDRELKELVRAELAEQRYLGALRAAGNALAERISGRFRYVPVSRSTR